MNARHKSLMIALVVLIGVLFLGPMGTVEVLIWLALLAVWVFAFVFWARTPHADQSRKSV